MGIHRREKIIFRAIEVINENGVQALTTKRIAELEKIAESTIFKHFSSKNEILMAVIDFYSQYDDDIIESIELKNLKGIAALIFYIESYIRYYENYPAITSITQGIDEMRYIEELSDRVVEVFRKRNDCLMKIIEEAKEKNQISCSYDSISYVDAIFGAVGGIIRTWRLEGYKFELLPRCMNAIRLILSN